MSKVSFLPLSAPPLSFRQFLSVLIPALEAEGLRPCVLRNYEGFPDINLGNDVDMLILPADLTRAVRALRSIERIRITGYTERPYVANTYIEGIAPAPAARALQLDFLMSLNWKGLPYLTADSVLRSAVRRQAGDLSFLVPSPIHEAIISLLSSLLVGGWLKEKYFSQVQSTFATDKPAVIAALSEPFGSKTATQLVDSILAGDRVMIVRCVRLLRISLASRSLLRKPFRGAAAIVRHFVSEFAIRFSPRTIESVCILSTDARSKAIIVAGLIPILHSASKEVVKHDHMSPLPNASIIRNAAGSADLLLGTFSRSLLTMANIVLWIAKEWLFQFIGKRNLTLRFCESSGYDYLIDPKRIRNGVPAWFVQLAAKLLPSPDLWILLDTPSDELQSGSQSMASNETGRLEAYRSFVKTRESYIILDAGKPVEALMEDAYAAIIDVLAQRARSIIDRRF
ncbi:MAG: hypothetical protein ABR907_08760 [Terracidiphilus sp.]|jgi:hypothetical protein